MPEDRDKYPEPALHASALYYDGVGILIRGASGSGKSSLLMRLLDDADIRGRNVKLVADDRVYITRQNQLVMMHCPENIKGLLEVRGLGILTLENKDKTPLNLVIDLVSPDQFERYPCEEGKISILEQKVSYIKITVKNPDAPAIVRMYLRHILNSEDPIYCV